MANFPTIAAPRYPLEYTFEDSVIRSQFESGVEQTRNRFTRRRNGYLLKWSRMSSTDWASLETFFVTTTSGGALSFNWTHPLTSVTSEYRFTAPPTVELIDSGYYQVQISIREV